MIHNLISRFADLDPGKLPKVSFDPGGAVVPNILHFVFGLTGALAMLVIAVAGFRYTVSRGNENSVKESKQTIIYAAIGLIVAISAYAIVSFVFERIK